MPVKYTINLNYKEEYYMMIETMHTHKKIKILKIVNNFLKILSTFKHFSRI